MLTSMQWNIFLINKVVLNKFCQLKIYFYFKICSSDLSYIRGFVHSVQEIPNLFAEKRVCAHRFINNFIV